MPPYPAGSAVDPAGSAVGPAGSAVGPAGSAVDSAERHLEVNRAAWDERAPAHAASPDYAFERFVEDPGSSATSSASTCHAWVTSPACAASTFSATSGPTRSRWLGSGPG